MTVGEREGGREGGSHTWITSIHTSSQPTPPSLPPSLPLPPSCLPPSGGAQTGPYVSHSSEQVRPPSLSLSFDRSDPHEFGCVDPHPLSSSLLPSLPPSLSAFSKTTSTPSCSTSPPPPHPPPPYVPTAAVASAADCWQEEGEREGGRARAKDGPRRYLQGWQGSIRGRRNGGREGGQRTTWRRKT